MTSSDSWTRRRLLGALGCMPVALAGCTQPQHPGAGVTRSQALALEATPSPESAQAPSKAVPPSEIPALGTKLTLTQEQWRARLTPEQFKILRQAGTEHAGTGAYLKNKAPGIYHCAGCNNPLFSSATKFESGTGWPSFWKPIQEGRVWEKVDTSHGMARVEVLCAHCEGHQGHVFKDGPPPTGLRYCVNSASLYFRPGSPSL